MASRYALLTMCAIGTQASFMTTATAENKPATIVPRPAEIHPLDGTFPLSGEIQIFADPANNEIRAVAEYLAQCLNETTALPATVVGSDKAIKAQFLLMLSDPDAPLGQEGYELAVSPVRILLRAPQPRGMFLGVQTIRQLMTQDPANKLRWRLPCLRITDQPRYRWRGMLLDCGRHFMSKEFVKRYIDLLAYHKMNVLHWHLTEDQGWRIEIKKYPKLTEVGAWRKATRNSELTADPQGRYGGFYTQDDVKEIVDYAKSRYITVVPEIEMPGHSMAALASYPELGCVGEGYEVATRWGIHKEVYCAGNDHVFEFLQNVLSEVIELFPSEFIHVGGDECPKERWKQCEKCRARIKAEGLKDEHELQSYFIRRIEKFLNSKGRRLIGWDEILEGGLAPNATVQSWRGMNGAIAAATAGHDVISSPTSHCYLDYAQVRLKGEPTWMGFLPLERVYSFEPTPTQLMAQQKKHVLGVEGNMWTEHAHQQRVDWQVFPRLCALAEVAWSPREQRDWSDFSRRMETHYRRLDRLGVTYFIPPPMLVSSDTVFTNLTDVILENPLARGAVHYTLDGGEPTQSSPKCTRAIRLTDSATLKARVFLESGRSSSIAEYRFRKLKPLDPVDVPTAAPGLRYEYYEGSWQELANFEQLTPAATGTCERFDLDVRKRDNRFALRFAGYLDVPVDGTYTFYLASDDGSKLSIGNELVVDNDGLHGTRKVSGQVILKAGKHPITVEYFQAGGPLALEVHYQGPSLPKQPIPDVALCQPRSSP